MSKGGNSFFYCLGQGIVGIRRNKVFFAASVATIAACIFLIGLFVSIAMNLSHIVEEAEETVCITVFFEEGMEEKEIQKIGEDIAGWSSVSRTEYTSAEAAWDNFRDEYFSDYPELAEGFAEDNPLANSASYDIYLRDISMQPQVVAQLEATEGIRQVNKSEVTADALSDMGNIVGIISIILIAVLLAVSVFLITNTIITGITLRKEEIKIMKYVGATDFFVKSPFVFEGVLIGLFGAVIPLVILFFVYRAILEYIVEQFTIIANTFTFLPIWNVFGVLIPVSLIIGAGIGLIGSLIATGKHIKV